MTNEHILLTPKGPRLTRTTRRLPADRRYDKEFLKLVRGVPWDDTAGMGPLVPKKRGAPSTPLLVPVPGTPIAPAPSAAPAGPAAAPAAEPERQESSSPAGDDANPSAEDSEPAVPPTERPATEAPSGSGVKRKGDEASLASRSDPQEVGMSTPRNSGDLDTPRVGDSPARRQYIEAQRDQWRCQADADTQNRDFVRAVATGPLVEEDSLLEAADIKYEDSDYLGGDEWQLEEDYQIAWSEDAIWEAKKNT